MVSFLGLLFPPEKGWWLNDQWRFVFLKLQTCWYVSGFSLLDVACTSGLDFIKDRFMELGWNWHKHLYWYKKTYRIDISTSLLVHSGSNSFWIDLEITHPVIHTAQAKFRIASSKVKLPEDHTAIHPKIAGIFHLPAVSSRRQMDSTKTTFVWQ